MQHPPRQRLSSNGVLSNFAARRSFGGGSYRKPGVCESFCGRKLIVQDAVALA
jgi:hypothetical protein